MAQKTCIMVLQYDSKEMVHGMLKDSMMTCYHDIMLVCSNGYLRAHRMILAASPFLKSILQESEAATTLMFPDFTSDTVENWLRLVCFGAIKDLGMYEAKELASLITILQFDPVITCSSYTVVNEESEVEEETVDLVQEKELINEEEKEDNQEEENDSLNKDEDHESGVDAKVVKTKTANNRTNTKRKKCSVNYICNSCFVNCRSRSKLKTHWWSAHSKERFFRCPQCLKKYHSLKYMLAHKNQVHSNENFITCSLCSITYISSTISQHIKVTHRHIMDEKNRTCNICFATFLHFRTYKAHLKKHFKSGV